MAQAVAEVRLVAGQVLLDDHDLDPGKVIANEPLVARLVATPRGPLDGVLSDPACAQDRDAEGRARGREERWPASLQGVEGGRDAVSGDIAQVLDQAPPVVAGHHVERDGFDAQALQQLDPLRPRGEVEHRDEDRAGSKQLVASLGRPQHDDDVLSIRRRLVDDAHSRRLGPVVVVGDAHAGPAPGLDVHVDVHVREQAAQRRQEGAPLAGLVVHAREADREPAVIGHQSPLSCGAGRASPHVVDRRPEPARGATRGCEHAAVVLTQGHGTGWRCMPRILPSARPGRLVVSPIRGPAANLGPAVRRPG